MITSGFLVTECCRPSTDFSQWLLKFFHYARYSDRPREFNSILPVVMPLIFDSFTKTIIPWKVKLLTGIDRRRRVPHFPSARTSWSSPCAPACLLWHRSYSPVVSTLQMFCFVGWRYPAEDAWRSSTSICVNDRRMEKVRHHKQVGMPSRITQMNAALRRTPYSWPTLEKSIFALLRYSIIHQIPVILFFSLF